MAQIHADAATCWKRISHPMWNEGLLRKTAIEAGEKKKWRRTCCCRCVFFMHAHNHPLDLSLQQTHMHAVQVPVQRVC